MSSPASFPTGMEGQFQVAMPSSEKPTDAPDNELLRDLLAGNPPPDYTEKTLERLCLAAGVKSITEVGALLRRDDLNERQDTAAEAVEFIARLIVRLRISPLFLFFGRPPMRIPPTVPLGEDDVEKMLAGLFGQEAVRRWKEAGYGAGVLLNGGREC